MPKITSYLAVGSNLGDRLNNIRRAIRYLQSSPRIAVKKISRLYETSPCGGPKDQPNYLNAAVEIKTSFNPFDLLNYLKTIEKKLKRKPSARWGVRLIDLDILFFQDLVLLHRDLCIPHPMLHKRMFVLKPLIDIGANFIHPLFKKRVRSLFTQLRKGNNNEEAITTFN